MSPDSLHEKRKTETDLVAFPARGTLCPNRGFFQGADLRRKAEEASEPEACRLQNRNAFAQARKTRVQRFGLTPLWRQARQFGAASLLDSAASARSSDASCPRGPVSSAEIRNVFRQAACPRRSSARRTLSSASRKSCEFGCLAASFRRAMRSGVRGCVLLSSTCGSRRP